MPYYAEIKPEPEYFVRLAQWVGPLYFILPPHSNITPEQAGFSKVEIEETRRKYVQTHNLYGLVD